MTNTKFLEEKEMCLEMNNQYVHTKVVKLFYKYLWNLFPNCPDARTIDD